MTTTVELGRLLASKIGGTRKVECEGDTILALLQDLHSQHPSLDLVDEAGEPKRFYRVVILDDVISDLSIKPPKTLPLSLIPAISGG